MKGKHRVGMRASGGPRGSPERKQMQNSPSHAAIRVRTAELSSFAPGWSARHSPKPCTAKLCGRELPCGTQTPQMLPETTGPAGSPPAALSAHGSPSPCLFLLSRSALAADAVPAGHPEARRAPPGHRRPGPAPAAEALLQTRVRRPRPAGTSPPLRVRLHSGAPRGRAINASSHGPSSAGAGGSGAAGGRAVGAGAVCSSSSSWSPERLRALLGAGTSGPGAGSCVWREPAVRGAAQGGAGAAAGCPARPRCPASRGGKLQPGPVPATQFHSWERCLR